MKRCPACRAECESTASQCWQCAYYWSRPQLDDEANATEEVRATEPRKRRKPSPKSLLRSGLGLLLLAAALTVLVVIREVRIPGMPLLLAASPLIWVLMTLICVVLASRTGSAIRGIGLGGALYCGVIFTGQVSYAFNYANGDDFSLAINAVGLNVLVGTAGVLGFVLLAVGIVRTPTRAKVPLTSKLAGGCYAVGALVGFATQFTGAPAMPDGFPAPTHTFVSVASSLTALIILWAAIGCATVGGGKWSALGLGLTCAVFEVGQVLVFYGAGIGQSAERSTASDAFFALGIVLAAVATVRPDDSNCELEVRTMVG